MTAVGIIGLGNMGMGMARNLLAAGFDVRGYARSLQTRREFAGHGGNAVDTAAQAARGVDALFVMVRSADQATDLLNEGLLQSLRRKSTVIITATLGVAPVQAFAALAADNGIDVIDAPVSGGKAGADNGTLTLMAAGRAAVLDRHAAALQAISGTLLIVGNEPGQGQAVKACLQTLIGVSFAGLFEAMVLGDKAGIAPSVLADVINHSFVGSTLTQVATGHIVARRFTDTGSHLVTMHKDLGISLDEARRLGVPMPTAGVALQMFQAGLSAVPDGDNWAIVTVLESMAGMNSKTSAP